VTSTAAITKPSSGETTSEVICLLNDAHLTAEKLPTDATPAPTRPPMTAWVELLGSPKNQVTRFQAIAPRRAAMTTTIPALKESVLAIVLATFRMEQQHRHQGPEEVEDRGQGHRLACAHGAGRDRGRDRVGGVVKAVGEVEGHRDHDGRDEEAFKHS